MKQFLLMLLFAKVVLLTPVPVTVIGNQELPLPQPLSALSPGASLEVQLPPAVAGESREKRFKTWSRINEMFPAGSIHAVLYDERGKQFKLDYRGKASMSEADVRLILDAKNGVPAKTKYVRLIVYSQRPLASVKIYWRNFKK
jgi:hypothetical protein